MKPRFVKGELSMEHSMSRILIETTVRQTLKGLKENPKRNIRNLVDMAVSSRRLIPCWKIRTAPITH